MSKILGLDLGTNSIGWAVVNKENTDNDTAKLTGIDAAGSRIIPMSEDIIGNFEKGESISQTAERTKFRGTRRIRERYLLRRERLHRVLNHMNFLPEHYSQQINRYGKFLSNSEPKLAWYKDSDDSYKFLFMNSFHEMLQEFQEIHPDLFQDGKKIPIDWTIYYLRKKALCSKISKEELAWILLNFNQKRGYYQLRGEDENIPENKRIEFYALKVTSVEETTEKKGNDTWYNIHLENGWIYRRTSKYPLDWEGKVKEFIVTTDIDENGEPKTDKEGNVKRSFRAPKEDDWTLKKTKTEYDLTQSGLTVGAYIYNSLLHTPDEKIIGKLIRTIDRKFYKEELKVILEKQKTFHPELQDSKLYSECLELLYEHNEAHRNNNANKDFSYLFINDILFYQRPLKSKKSLIANCPYEEHVNKSTGEHYPIKCIAKSHPLFQEFRLLQFLQNIRIYLKEGVDENGRLKTDINVTNQFLKTVDDYENLFEWLNNKKEIDQKEFLKYPGFGLKKDALNYRWNYVEDKKYPCNETRALITSRLSKAGVPESFLTKETEEALWHILYSVDDTIEIKKALESYAQKNDLPSSFVEQFAKFPPFKKDYGSYSAKAIKKLLSVMRFGKWWSVGVIDNNTKLRIEKIISGEYDEKIGNRVREMAFSLQTINDFQFLPLWLACYIVYNRHSEAKDITKWEKPDDIDTYLDSFKQHSLRNPIVEQVITETLRTVRDIWKQCGTIDEIHLELGREMKNPADKRKAITERNIENENTNLRIKALLMEFMNPDYDIEGVRPYSPMQQDILKIYEDYALSNLDKDDKDYEFVSKIAKLSQPSSSDIKRYKLWLEQKYRSPYTGEVIPLGRLFTEDYQIEHVIPQAKYFDDSFSNKVICEAAVNQLKSSQLGHEFISKHAEEIVAIGNKQVKIFSVEAYEKFVKEHYSNNKIKMKKLLMDEIPDQFIERQLNDSRYISREIQRLLSNIVREEGEEESTSKNLIPCSGGITDRLKKEWGVNDVWNRIVLPRFKRLNEITNNSVFTTRNTSGEEIPSMPLELQKGFNKKRIDHRHHAMDAIVIACATRDHVNLLNNEAALSKNNANRHALSRKLRRYEKTIIERNGEKKEIDVAKEFYKPWDTFTQDVYATLNNIIVSFKQNLRVINKTVNHYQHYNQDGKKVLLTQEKGDSWAIRKPMHKDTIFAEVNLRKIKEVSLKVALENPTRVVKKDLKKLLVMLLDQGYDAKKIAKYLEEHNDIWNDVNPKKIQVYYFTKETNDRYFATRKSIDTSFDKKKIEESITDTGIQKILLRHLEQNDNNPEKAFSPDGIEQMNANIRALNNGKAHQPILKVRVYEKADKFAIGQNGNKSKKFVEAAKGTNLFFAVYANAEGKRSFATIPLNVVVERQKQGLNSVPETNEAGDQLLFTLSPNDLVYLPTQEEIQQKKIISNLNSSQIYKVVSSSGPQCFFITETSSKPIINKFEFSSLNKMERALTGEMIKETCISIKIDRLGNLVSITNVHPFNE